VQSSPHPVRPRQFTTLGLQEAQNAVANTLHAAHRQLLQARFGIEILLSVPYGPNMTCPPSSPFTDTDVANITTTLQRIVREVAKELHNAPDVLRRPIATSLFDAYGADVQTELPPFACALIHQFLQERQLDSAIRTPHDRRMIRVWTAQGLHAMVMWHITLHAQWRYRHTTWNALDLNARPRGSYRRIDLFMSPPLNTSTTTFDRSPDAVPGANASSGMYQHYVESIVGLLPLMNTEWQHMDKSIGGHSKISRYVLRLQDPSDIANHHRSHGTGGD